MTAPDVPPLPALPDLQRRLVEFAAARQWGPYHTPKNLAAALSVEAAELLEIFQWMTPEEADRVMADPETAHRVNDEVADVLAYLLQFSARLGVDPLAALSAKIDRNELRFPVGRPPGRTARATPAAADPAARAATPADPESPVDQVAAPAPARAPAPAPASASESTDRHSTE